MSHKGRKQTHWTQTKNRTSKNLFLQSVHAICNIRSQLLFYRITNNYHPSILNLYIASVILHNGITIRFVFSSFKSNVFNSYKYIEEITIYSFARYRYLEYMWKFTYLTAPSCPGRNREIRGTCLSLFILIVPYHTSCCKRHFCYIISSD